MFNPELLAVNQFNATNSIDIYTFSSGNIIPLVQDTFQANVWSAWDVEYRDVVILDSSNRVAGIMNLTYNDLAIPTNREQLKQMFRNVANSGDSDADKLPDHWEYRSFGGLSAAPGDDPDGDGVSNLNELAFGSNPNDPLSFPRVTLGFTASKQFRVSFDRWAGSALDFLVEGSTNLFTWTNSASFIRSTTTNHWDGTGRSRATYSLVRSSTVQPSGFVRVNARPRP